MKGADKTRKFRLPSGWFPRRATADLRAPGCGSDGTLAEGDGNGRLIPPDCGTGRLFSVPFNVLKSNSPLLIRTGAA
ncbi:MAG: hypothetical protein CSA73_00195 [Rhodobacterales bacterium]|nr:MAG: hypothetical protein CSA73_00195 [Rhodobacterales bacterium]